MTKEDKILFFVSFCIEQYKTTHEMKGSKVADLFAKEGGIDYLEKNYDVLHTQKMTEINQNNLYLLLPGKILAVAKIYAQQHHIPVKDAMKLFYGSLTYKRLEDEDTKFWHYGPVALYQEFEENN